MWTPMTQVMPESKYGRAQIKHYEVDEETASRSQIRQAVTGGREQPVREGVYAQLLINGSLVMSDTQMEQNTNQDLIYAARGRVLLAGLGLGMVILPLLEKKGVRKITVVEKSSDVIKLVGGHLRTHLGDDDRLEIIKGDIFTWDPPRTRYETIYFDIWGTIHRNNLRDIRLLHRRFRSKLTKQGWMRSWLQDDLKYY